MSYSVHMSAAGGCILLKWKKGIPSPSIYQKLVMMFLLILFPLYALSLAMNSQGSRTVEEQIHGSMQSQLHYYTSQLKSEFSHIIWLLQEHVNDADLLKLSMNVAVMNDIEVLQTMLRLINRLQLLSNTSDYIHYANVHIPLLNRTLSSNENNSGDFNKAQYSALLRPTNRYEAPFIPWQEKLYISVPYPSYTLPLGENNLFLLDIEVSTPAIQGMLAQLSRSTAGGAVLFDANGLWMIGSEGESAQTRHLQSQLLDGVPQLSGIERLSIEGHRIIVAFEFAEGLNAYLALYMPEAEVLGPLRQYRMSFWLLSVVSAAVVFLFAYQIYRWIHRPIQTLVQSFRKVEQGDLNVAVAYPYKDEFHYLYEQFNEMVRQLNILVHEVYEQRYRARSSELKHLQSQINPHFLYNSYFVLYRMIKNEDYEQLETFARYLGEYFQFITRDQMEYIPLAMEVKYARTYTDIQTIRFANRIVVQFDPLPSEFNALEVPRLIVQPLIENAYQHGLERKAGQGLMRIQFLVVRGDLVIRIEDNGEQMDHDHLLELRKRLRDPEDQSETTGMVNVHRRIQIMYGTSSGLTLDISSLGGLQVDLHIPLNT